MKIRIVLAILILSILTGSALAGTQQGKQIRARKKLLLKAEKDSQKADQIRLRKRLRTLAEQEEEQINAIVKMFFGGEDSQQSRTRTSTRKKVCDQTGDQTCLQDGEMKQDRTRVQKQDGTCGDVLKAKGDGTGDGEPDQDRTRTRERKKVCDQTGVQTCQECQGECEKECEYIRIRKRDRLSN